VLRAGRPIVGVPFAYDQFSLCARVERLGVGLPMPVGRRTRADFAAVLARLLSDDALARRAAEAGPRFDAERTARTWPRTRSSGSLLGTAEVRPPADRGLDRERAALHGEE